MFSQKAEEKAYRFSPLKYLRAAAGKSRLALIQLKNQADQWQKGICLALLVDRYILFTLLVLIKVLMLVKYILT